MAVTDPFAGEIAAELLKSLGTDLLKQLFDVVNKSSAPCKESAERLIEHYNEILPIITEIRYSGVELPQHRQLQLSRLSTLIKEGFELSKNVLGSRRWHVYRNHQLSRKMEMLEKKVAKFVQGPMLAHILADVHHLRRDTTERFDQLDKNLRRMGQSLDGLRIGGGVGLGAATGLWLDEEKKRLEGFGVKGGEGNLVDSGVALDLGVGKVKEMLIEKEDATVVGLVGTPGIGKTTLAMEICKDDQVINYFGNRILFLTVSQSPTVEALKLKIWAFVSGTEYVSSDASVPQWGLPCNNNIKFAIRKLVVLDDVWSLSVLEQLVFRAPGCKTLVASRTKFNTVFNLTYQVELLNEDEALALFCLSAFGQKTIPFSADQALVKQLVGECKGLPLALKVVGASLRDKPQLFWASAKNRLSRGEPISEAHETNLVEPMKLSIAYLGEKVRECFLDLGSFPEDKRIPLDVLINIWVEIHDINAVEAYAILTELSERNLVDLVKDSRAGDMYSSNSEIYLTQHDVLRDLAIYMSNQGKVNDRRRLLMPKREDKLPKEWVRNSDQPFNAHTVSIHTGKMKQSDWWSMQFPKAEVLILNFSSSEYYLPPFMTSMPRLRALIIINHSTSHATLHNLSVFTHTPNLRSLWLEGVCIPNIPNCTTVLLDNMQKLSIMRCKVDPSSDPSSSSLLDDMPSIFPQLEELTIDHCMDLTRVPNSTCWLQSLTSLSVTNCHSLIELPSDLGMLDSLQILRLFACPKLKSLPQGTSQLIWLKYLDISQCINLASLPQGMSRMMSLEKIDMRECSNIKLVPKLCPDSLREVVCDEEISWMWNEMEKDLPNLRVQIAEESYSLDWLTE